MLSSNMKLNLKQKKILKLLSINCRFSNKDIGKAVKISEDSVAYQIDKLINKEKLGRFNVTFYYPLLGYHHYHIWIKLKNLNANYEKLSKISSVISINSSFGKFDLQLIILTKTKKQLNETIKEIKNSISIQTLQISKFNSFYKRFTNILPPIDVNVRLPKNKKDYIYKLSDRVYAHPDKGTKIKLDNKDRKIIKELLQNPRASYLEISRKTGINHETIRYRIKNYVEKKFINNFGLLHDFKKYNLYTNYFLLNLKKHDEKKFRDFLMMNENIFYCAKLEGGYNCIVYIVSSNPHELGENFSNLMNVLSKSVKKIDLLFLNKIHKYVQFPEGESY